MILQPLGGWCIFLFLADNADFAEDNRSFFYLSQISQKIIEVFYLRDQRNLCEKILIYVEDHRILFDLSQITQKIVEIIICVFL